MANIPYSGFNGAIATYTADTCITITSVTDNASWITVSSGNSTINGNVQANTTLSSRTATVTVGYKADATNCSKSFNVTQDARPCNCGDLTLSPTALTWAYSATSANSSSVTISKDACITNVSVPQGTNFTTSLNNNAITIRPKGKNTSASELSETILVSYSASTSTCTSAITLTQGTSGACNCESVTFTALTTTIGSGGTSNSSIARYGFNGCSGEIVSGETDVTWLKYLNADNNRIHVSAQTNTELGNERSGITTVYYKANPTDTNLCRKEFTITQISVPCDCDAFKYFITPIKTEFGYLGTHGNMILIASADTQGCGSLSAQTDSLWFADEHGNSGASIITEYVEGTDNEQANFYLNVLPYGDWPIPSARTAQSQIIFIPKDPSLGTCSGHSFTITQYESENKKYLATCDEIEISAHTPTVDCEGIDSEGRLNYIKLTPKYLDVELRADGYDPIYYTISASTSEGWVSIINGGVSESSAIISFNPDTYYPSTSARTSDINFLVYRTDGHGGIDEICSAGTFTLTQQGCTDSDCSGCSWYYIDTTSLESSLRYVDSSGASFNLFNYVQSGHEFCTPDPDDLKISVDIDSYYTSFISYDPSTYMLTFTRNDTGAERPFYLRTYLHSVSEDTTCTSYAPQISGRQNKEVTCTCGTWSTSVYGGTNIDETAHNLTVHLEYNGYYITRDDIEACHPDAVVSAYTLSPAVTNISSGRTSVNVGISANDSTSARTITVYVPIGYFDTENNRWETICLKDIQFTQAGKIDCNCDIDVRPNYYPVYSGQAREVAEVYYEHYGECVSGSVVYLDSEYSDMAYVYISDEYHTDYYDELVISASNTMSQTGCTTIYATIDVYDSDGNVCNSSSIPINLNTGCHSDINNLGTLTGTSSPIPSTATSVVVGTITASEVGDENHLCHSFIAADQGGYLDNINFVPTSTNNDGTINYNIVANCTGKVGGPFDVNIGVNRSADCSTSSYIPLGTISLTTY